MFVYYLIKILRTVIESISYNFIQTIDNIILRENTIKPAWLQGTTPHYYWEAMQYLA